MSAMVGGAPWAVLGLLVGWALSLYGEWWIAGHRGRDERRAAAPVSGGRASGAPFIGDETSAASIFGGPASAPAADPPAGRLGHWWAGDPSTSGWRRTVQRLRLPPEAENRWVSRRVVTSSVVTAVLFTAAGWRFADRPAVLPMVLYVVAVGVVLAAIDLDTRRLPNVLTLPSYPIVAFCALVGSAAGLGWSGWGRGLVGLIAALVLYGVIWIVGGMGLGDVKLAGVLGFALGWLGWSELVVGLLLGFGYGGLVSLALILVLRVDRKAHVSFGPYLIAGALTAFYVAVPLTTAYFSVALR